MLLTKNLFGFSAAGNRWRLALLILALLLPLPVRAAESKAVPKPGENMATPVKPDNLDAAAFAEWVDGKESRIEGGQDRVPENVIWTSKGKVGAGVFIFGDSKTPGPRHLRIGFKKAIPLGSVLTMDGGSLSALKSGAKYPGDPANEGDWVAGQKIGAKSPGLNQYALWVFPPGTETRALRLTQVSAATDNQYAGKPGTGIFVFAERWSNVAPQAAVTASTNTHQAERVQDFSKNTFWENINKEDDISARAVISGDHPEWLLLTWPAPVALNGLVALQAGFASAEVQAYTGPAGKHPREAAEADWKSLGNFSGIENGGSVGIWPNLLDFGRTETTRAIRLRLTSPMAQTGVLKEQSRNGYRVALSELMAVHPLGNSDLDPVAAGLVETSLPPPIPIKFNLKEPGYVTLVIEDSQGMRVRNLLSETWFPAGANTAWWDGTDDLSRDLEAAKKGLYSIPPHPVVPGEYRVRGLARKAIQPRFEFSIYTAGNPAWPTADRTGGWLSNHSAPQSALFLPGKDAPGGRDLVLLGSYVSEGRDGLAWVDLDGRKLGGQGTVGGNWTGAPFLARDTCEKPNAYAYAASSWETGKKSGQVELRLTALGLGKDNKDKPVLVHPLGDLSPNGDKGEVGGLAVYNGIAFVSLVMKNQLLIVDVEGGQVLGSVPLEEPRGLAFDSQGRLLALSGKKLLRYPSVKLPLPAPETLVASGLEVPTGLALDGKGGIYISDRGASHQVKVFSEEGKPLRVIGKAGAPQAGPYDPLHMNNPAGLTVDSQMRLWVAECDYLPKRVSVWSLDGNLLKAFYGPAKYGGGGTLDSRDRNRFFYADEGRGAIEFGLDWEKGTSQPLRVYYRPGPDDMKLAFRSGAPETPLYLENRRYFTNAYNSSPTGGHGTAFIFLDKDGLAKPVAAAGQAKNWELFTRPEFSALLPAGTDLVKGKGGKDSVFFIWNDLNGDYQAQPGEVAVMPGPSGGITVMPDLSFVASRMGDLATQFSPTGFTPDGAPKYDLSKKTVLLKGVQGPGSSGGDQVLTGEGGLTIATLGAAPFHRFSLSGGKDGAATWSYPSLWPGLHAGHESPVPDIPGEMTATTRLLGGFVKAKGSEAGQIWAVNSDQGKVYLFTSDGFFIATLFIDTRIGKKFTMPTAERGMDLSDVTLHGENFWPTLAETSDGKVYLVDGGRTSLIRLDGLESVYRLPDAKLAVTAEDLKKSQDWLGEVESKRQQSEGTGVLKAALRPIAPAVDGKLDDWKDASWVEVDQRGAKAYFNSASRPFDVTAAVAVAGDKLYAAWRTGNPKLLENTGAVPQAPFKTGGALDIMLGTDGSAAPGRNAPVAGDLRLLVTEVGGKPLALIYRAVVPGTKDADKIPFSSPWRTITMDQVQDVSSQVESARDDKGNYEISIPLKTLGLAPSEGMRIKGDIGILRGDGIQTSARVYWNNKGTALVEDVPAEAMLTPGMWGIFQFQAPEKKK